MGYVTCSAIPGLPTAQKGTVHLLADGKIVQWWGVLTQHDWKAVAMVPLLVINLSLQCRLQATVMSTVWSCAQHDQRHVSQPQQPSLWLYRPLRGVLNVSVAHVAPQHNLCFDLFKSYQQIIRPVASFLTGGGGFDQCSFFNYLTKIRNVRQTQHGQSVRKGGFDWTPPPSDRPVITFSSLELSCIWCH